MRKAWYLALLVVCAVAVAPLFANGSSESSASSASGSVAFWTSHTPPDSTTIQAMVDKFNQDNPNIKVTMTIVPGSETDVAKLMTAVRGGTGPDIYMLDRFTIAQRAAAGVLTNLTPFIQKTDPSITNKYLGYAWAETQYRGNTYGLPFDTDSRALYYNKDLVQSAGFDPAMADPSHGPLTIDQVRQVAMKLNKTDSSGAYTQVGFIPYDHTYSQGWHYTWGFDFGGKFADLQAGKITPTDPGVVKAYQFMKDWAAMMGPQKVQTFISTYAPPNNPPQQDPFLTGKVAMEVTGDWMLNNIRQYAPNLNYGVTYIPVPNAGDKPSTWAGGWSMVIPQGAKNAAAAWKFISWACGEPGSTMYTTGTHHLSPVKTVNDNNSLYSGEDVFFKQILSVAHSRPPLPVGALYWDALTAAQDAVTLKQADVMTELQNIYNQVQPQYDQVK